MNDNSTSTPVDPTPVKKTMRDRLRRSAASADPQSAAHSLKEKAKNTAAVIGVVTVAGAAALIIAKKRGVNGVEVTLPDVDASPENV